MLSKIKKSLGLYARLSLLGVSCMAIAGCESISGLSTQGSVKDGKFCDLYKPVFTIPSDSELTKIQVDNNNVLYEECLK